MQELLNLKNGYKRKILLVDDEFIEREMLCAMLSDFYEIVYAENGAVALDIIKNSKPAPAIVILDLHMPELDGYSVLKIIRSDSELRRIPVIVLTSEKVSEVKCLQMGAADFITKPYDEPEIIRARIRHSIELAEDSVIIHETERDELTGLFNKEFFFQYGKKLDEQNDKNTMDALVLDINRFHIVNELYGRAYGDMVLEKLGNAIREFARETGGLACRSDSNSFFLYLPHDEELENRMSKFIDHLNSIIEDQKISFRIGIYSDSDEGLSMDMRFDRAKVTCQKLRNNYASCYAFYDSELHKKELFSERLINDIDKALAEHQFKVFYQPKYNINGDKPVLSSAEALIRWFHPEYGMISPGLFISLFEENGLIHKLDKFVWNEAAAQVRKWHDEYGITLPVSVNVSRVDIFDPMLIDVLCNITKENGISVEELLLEITESAYADNSQQIVDTVSDLRTRGFKIEMDDFGSGYSSLNMLTSLPIDALKLDMQFIRKICIDKKSLQLVKIMMEIARLLEVPVIAEGVETKQQLDLLKELGCDIIQGYYFSKPLPPEEFRIHIEKLINKEQENDYADN